MRQCIEDVSFSPKPKALTLGKSRDKTKREYCITKDDEIDIIDTCNAFMTEDGERRIKRVLLHLGGLCLTTEAKRSLWGWQLAFARHERNEKLLPVGGKMTDERTGWVSRMGRAIIGSGKVPQILKL
jgi:hypothetical protein